MERRTIQTKRKKKVMAGLKRTNSSRSTELGHWDRLRPGTLGCSAAMLEILFKQQNTGELYRIRGNWVHCSWDKLWTGRCKKLKKWKEKPNCYFWRAGRKNKVSGAGVKARCCACPLTSIPPRGWANHLSHFTLTPYKEPAHPILEDKGICHLFSLSPAVAGVPIKPCLNFSSGL